MGFWFSRAAQHYTGSKHGLVPPRLACQLERWGRLGHPLYDSELPPPYSLECELVWRSVPFTMWYNKREEEIDSMRRLKSLGKKIQRGLGQRKELEELRGELVERLDGLAMGYTVLRHARQRFLIWLIDRKLSVEYAYEALEEYAEGVGGSLSLFWPSTARQKCWEGALVRADWILDRFAKERAETGTLRPPRLAFLHSSDPDHFSRPPRPTRSSPLAIPRHAFLALHILSRARSLLHTAPSSPPRQNRCNGISIAPPLRPLLIPATTKTSVQLPTARRSPKMRERLSATLLSFLSTPSIPLCCRQAPSPM